MGLNWEKIWDEFNGWMDDPKRHRRQCKACSHVTRWEPEWPDQMSAIRRIVERHIKSKPPKG
jgi:hypothetical protein